MQKYKVKIIETDKSVTQILYGIYKKEKWWCLITADKERADKICKDMNLRIICTR